MKFTRNEASITRDRIGARSRTVVALSMLFSLSGCAPSSSIRHSCTPDGQIQTEVIKGGTWPEVVSSVSYRDDTGGYCDGDNTISEDEASKLSS